MGCCNICITSFFSKERYVSKLLIFAVKFNLHKYVHVCCTCIYFNKEQQLFNKTKHQVNFIVYLCIFRIRKNNIILFVLRYMIETE